MNEKEQMERTGLETRIRNFLETACSNLSLDDEEDRATCAKNLADWIYAAQIQETDMTQQIIPRAIFRSGLHVVDETTRQHIVTLLLERDRVMTDGDWKQMQNFLWCCIGRVIRENKDVQKMLKAGGIQIFTDNPFGGGGESAPMM